jgi:recombination protein RecT
MAVTNSLTKQPPAKPKFSVVIQQDAYKNLVNNTLGDQKRAQRFIAAVSSAVAVNPALQECEAGSILSGALLGEKLNLYTSPKLGNYYIVP